MRVSSFRHSEISQHHPLTLILSPVGERRVKDPARFQEQPPQTRNVGVPGLPALRCRACHDIAPTGDVIAGAPACNRLGSDRPEMRRDGMADCAVALPNDEEIRQAIQLGTGESVLRNQNIGNDPLPRLGIAQFTDLASELMA